MGRFVRSMGNAPAMVGVLAALLLTATSGYGQSVSDPRRVEFTPSGDHDAVDASGTPLVQGYTLKIFLSGGTQPVQTVSLGKPAPDPDGMIRVSFVSLLPAPLTAGLIYEVRVSADGPGGSGTSSSSNTFSFTPAAPPCAPSISTTSQTIDSSGGTVAVNVTAGSGCDWSVASNSGWITLASAANGSGNGTVTISASNYTGSSSRSGTVTIAGRTFTLTQTGVGCSFTLDSTSHAFGSTGGTDSIVITAPSGCSWTATESMSWLTISSGASGSGNGTVNYSATANSSSSARSGTITIGGKAFAVTESGASCSPALSASSQSFGSIAGSGAVGVTAAVGCSWTARSNASWITISSGASGSGNGTVGFDVTANTGTSTRSGTLTIAGNTFSVTQSANTCAPTISPSNQSLGAAGGSGTITVSAGSGCDWTARESSSWIAISSGASGSGNGTVRFSASANSGSARSATMTVAGQTVTISETAASCSITVSPSAVTVSYTGSSGKIGVTASGGCSWSAASSVKWITVTGSGSSSGTVTYTVSNNPSKERTGTVTVGGKTITFTQAAKVPGPVKNLRIVVK